MAVSTSGGVLLLDASPDLRSQLSLLPEGPPRRPVDGVVLTHGHMGHYTGLVHFGREALSTDRLPVYCTEAMASFLSGNSPWAELVSWGHIEMRPVAPGQSVSPWTGTAIRLVPVPHRAELTDTVAVSVDDHLLYVPDIDDWELWPAAGDVVAAHSIALLDATFYRRGEVPDRSHDDIPHPPVEDTITRFGALTARHRLVLTHLNWTNPLCDPASPEAARVRSAGFTVALDGLRL